MATFTIDICGPTGCGKSAYMRRHLTGDFTYEYLPLTQCKLVYNTNYGKMTMIVREGVSLLADARMVLIDGDKIPDAKQITKYLETAMVPAVLCRSKADRLRRRPTQYKLVRNLMKSFGVKYFDISSKSNYNFEKPLQTLLRELTGYNDLVFTALPERVV